MKANKIWKYLGLFVILIFLLWLVSYSTLRPENVKVLELKYVDNSNDITKTSKSEQLSIVNTKEIRLPFKSKSTNIDEYLFTGFINKGIISQINIKIIPDDSVKYIKINDLNIPLDNFSQNELSDWSNGFVINIGKYCKIGKNKFEIEIADLGKGEYGLIIDRSYKDIILLIILFLILLNISTICYFYFQDFFDLKKPSTYIIIILVISYFTYIHLYFQPRAVFWDENYHVASAEKYINGMFFMEPHPPLGKMFIAISEIIINPNKNVDTKYFLDTDYIKDFPVWYSFAGVRFPSTLFAALSSVIFFLILFLLFENPVIAFFFTFLYLFENAIIVHSRGAMLEGTQIFFILCAILYFVYVIQKKTEYKNINYFILGLLIGLTVSIKANSTILILLLIFLIACEFFNNIIKKEILNFIRVKNLSIKFLIGVGGILAIFFFVWYLHFALCSKVHNNNYYKASATYRDILDKGQAANPLYFFVMLKDHLNYAYEYEKGVPKLDRTKSDENGSYPLEWTIGKKSINYRWAKYNDYVRYLYLQVNPATWYISLVLLILSFVLILSTFLFKQKIKDKKLFLLNVFFVLLYLCYMIAMFRIERVMYLYHYFVALLFSHFAGYIFFCYIFKDRIQKNDKKLIYIVSGIGVIVIAVYLFFSPLTYYGQLTTKQFELRTWNKAWKLEAIK